jgi:hypothetical protein
MGLFPVLAEGFAMVGHRGDQGVIKNPSLS